MNGIQAKPHILVMDDERVIRTMIVATLRRNGYAVTEAADGRSAVEQFALLPEEARAHCLLILDLTILGGGLGGRETLAEIRKDHPEIKAIIASGVADERMLQELKEPGKTELLSKPFDLKTLNAAVRAMHDEPV